VDTPEESDTAVFWGRLDFEPNIQALRWFCRRVWPIVRQQRPQARFAIVGFHPTPEVQDLARTSGVTLRPNVDDIRTEVARYAIVVVPVISGAGIKNKLLEAAAMGKAIACSPRALLGLGSNPPLTIVNRAEDWPRALAALWDDNQQRRKAGLGLRSWVVAEHSWERTACMAVDALAAIPPDRTGRRA
jgi:glycosyltransferase involved in cell wall biosynthesis